MNYSVYTKDGTMRFFKNFIITIFIFAITSCLVGASPVAYEATAYTKDCKGCNGITSTGIQANAWGKVKIMAVDPRFLKLGKCYTLQFEDGHKSVYLAADTGGHIKGKRIDLLLKSSESAKKFGRQIVKVHGVTKCHK